MGFVILEFLGVVGFGFFGFFFLGLVEVLCESVVDCLTFPRNGKNRWFCSINCEIVWGIGG